MAVGAVINLVHIWNINLTVGSIQTDAVIIMMSLFLNTLSTSSNSIAFNNIIRIPFM